MHSNGDFLRNSDIATDMWYAEINDPGYDWNNPGFSMGTGHFTQVVWKSVTHVGFGISGSFVCGRYNPPGNYYGQFPEEVPRLVPGWEKLKAVDDAIKAAEEAEKDRIAKAKRAAEREANKPKTRREFLKRKPEFDFPKGAIGARWSVSVQTRGKTTTKTSKVTFRFSDGHTEVKDIVETFVDPN
jgi:hypothetical protein